STESTSGHTSPRTILRGTTETVAVAVPAAGPPHRRPSRARVLVVAVVHDQPYRTTQGQTGSDQPATQGAESRHSHLPGNLRGRYQHRRRPPRCRGQRLSLRSALSSILPNPRVRRGPRICCTRANRTTERPAGSHPLQTQYGRVRTS